MMALLDLPYETIDLDMANGAHKADDYLKISPFGQVPAIDDNGITLSDSNAILIYLEKKYNDGYECLVLSSITMLPNKKLKIFSQYWSHCYLVAPIWLAKASQWLMWRLTVTYHTYQRVASV